MIARPYALFAVLCLAGWLYMDAQPHLTCAWCYDVGQVLLIAAVIVFAQLLVFLVALAWLILTLLDEGTP